MRPRLRIWLVVWAGWTILALFFATSTSLTYRSTGRPGNWTMTIGRALADWWVWAALTPLTVALVRRFPVEGRYRWRHLALLCLAGLLVAAGKTLLDRTVYAWMSGVRLYLLASTVAFQCVVFGCVAAAAHGVEYYRRSRERERLQARVADMRLQMLGMQLQPHFLFNTLNTIAELVYDHPAQADRMIVDLSELLRLSLAAGGAPIRLDQEIELLERYVEIQRARFGERLRITISIAADALAARVPPLVLQPLVENAIRHAVAARVTGGGITVTAVVVGQQLRITVADDGPDAVDLLSWTGVGLSNTRERLVTLYGTDARFELSRDGGLTTARIEFPAACAAV